MTKHYFLMLTVGLAALCGKAATAAVPTRAQWDEAYRKADEKIAQLTMEEKTHFLRGHSDFYFYGVPQKGIPYLYLSDASQGVHIRTNLTDTSLVKQLERSTAFPAPIMLTATFNPELSRAYAQAVGEECRAGGVEVLLGPGVNITKNAQCGRNFEYMGEDPLLSAAMAAAYIEGMLSTETAPCLKHFICNETEFYRRRSNSVVDERALHEIYLPPFKAGIEAGCPYVMTAYNKVNGEYAGESRTLITDLLRGELGFRGSVMSDWRSVYDPEKVFNSGQNTVMPGNRKEVAMLNDYLKKGKVSEARIDSIIRPVIATGYAYGLYDRDKYRPELLDRFPEHAQVAYNTAAEGIVLLKNNGILPLKKGSKILLAGSYLDKMPQDTGRPSSSAAVEGYDNVMLDRAMTERFGNDVTVKADPTDAELRAADVVVAVVGTVDEEAFERPFALPKAQENFVRNAVKQNPNTVVLVLTGSGIRMASWNDKAAAVVYGWYPGQNGTRAIADMLAGDFSPSGKLPMTIEREFKDSPCHGVMPEGGSFYNDSWRCPNEALIMPFDVNYDESVLVGYRWYDTKNIKPLYPFGHGLSYTTFALSKPQVKVAGDKIKVKVILANTGSREGAETVQVYVGENNPSVLRPVKELKAFRKVALAPGKNRTVEFEIDSKELSFWDDKTHGWKLNPGEYTVSIGTSSADIAHSLPIVIK